MYYLLISSTRSIGCRRCTGHILGLILVAFDRTPLLAFCTVKAAPLVEPRLTFQI